MTCQPGILLQQQQSIEKEVIAVLAEARKVEPDVLVARLEDKRIPMDLAAATGKKIPLFSRSGVFAMFTFRSQVHHALMSCTE